jgi:hypothetical protein
MDAPHLGFLSQQEGGSGDVQRLLIRFIACVEASLRSHRCHVWGYLRTSEDICWYLRGKCDNVQHHPLELCRCAALGWYYSWTMLNWVLTWGIRNGSGKKHETTTQKSWSYFRNNRISSALRFLSFQPLVLFHDRATGIFFARGHSQVRLHCSTPTKQLPSGYLTVRHGKPPCY